ncbi:LysR family transcriptional regulator [Nitratireductor indicus]|uniref:LysR family transcriptional regulator n=1 Tax=Nitratireductor indicus TaxID=721133 RepID=UPI002874D893|nr:LysR family transcriptional regulator [Nitratireductor indicus]MDS1138728.1 LysR family transcriptional regulator [Nitratireductor indicus]
MANIRHLLPSMNALVTFEAAVRCGTFARAARELSVTSPAVSRTIGRLEAHMGVSLFHRTSTGAVLTEEGSVLFASVSSGFADIEKTLLKIRRKRRPELETVVFSASSAFVTHWFMPRLARFQKRFPQVDIRFQLISGPLGGPTNGTDIAMRFDHGGDTRHVALPLMPELLVPIQAPHYRQGVGDAGTVMPVIDRIISLSDAKPDWSGLFSNQMMNGKVMEGELSGLQFSDYTVVVQAALLGQGVALGWLNVVSHLLANGELQPAGSALSTGRTIELVMLREPQTTVLSCICDWIEAEFASDLKDIDVRYPAIGALWRDGKMLAGQDKASIS